MAAGISRLEYILNDLDGPEDAVESYERATAISPDYANAFMIQ